MNIYAVIPIRSGSKRFPNKNIYEISGIPLFQFSADVAKRSDIFSQIIISSDSAEYLKLANTFNYTTHHRSSGSACDTTNTEEVITEVIKYFNFNKEDWVFIIQATNPFQQIKYFKNATSYITNEISSIVTYRKFKRFFLHDLINGERKRTQDLPDKFLETGLFWAFNVAEFLKFKKRIIQPYALVEIDEIDDVDIDYFADLQPHLPRLELIAKEIRLKQ
jgi:CMP-N-acetylneuraminic acid synthetase